MKAKAARALCLLNAGLLLSGIPAVANKPTSKSESFKATLNASKELNADQKLQIQLAEKDLHDFERQHGATNIDYSVQLANLANIYLRNNQMIQAEKALERSLAAAKRLRNPDLVIPDIMSNWAFSMALKDKVKAKEAMDRGMASANNLPFGSGNRLGFLFNRIQLYKQIGENSEADKQIADVDDQMRALEKAKGLDDNIIASVAYMLRQMSGLYCLPSNRKTEDFKKAEAYQIRAIAQYDKLPKDRRLLAHAQLQEWYQNFGMKQKSEEQENIIKSLNDGKPFIKRVCHGCGMG